MALLYDDGFLDGPDDYYDCYVDDDIDCFISTANKKELIDFLHKGYDMYMGSNYMTLEEICRGRKKLTEDEIRNLPENDEDYEIWVDDCIDTIEIWL